MTYLKSKERQFMKTKTQCPICWEAIPSYQRVRLECAHLLCQSCALQWILKESTCPLCRSKTSYYDRDLRSSSPNTHLFRELNQELNHINVFRFESYLEYVQYVGSILEYYLFQHRHVWYRPHLRRSLKSRLEPTVSLIIPFLRELRETSPPPPPNLEKRIRTLDLFYRKVQDIIQN